MPSAYELELTKLFGLNVEKKKALEDYYELDDLESTPASVSLDIFSISSQTGLRLKLANCL